MHIQRHCHETPRPAHAIFYIHFDRRTPTFVRQPHHPFTKNTMQRLDPGHFFYSLSPSHSIPFFCALPYIIPFAHSHPICPPHLHTCLVSIIIITCISILRITCPHPALQSNQRRYLDPNKSRATIPSPYLIHTTPYFIRAPRRNIYLCSLRAATRRRPFLLYFCSFPTNQPPTQQPQHRWR